MEKVKAEINWENFLDNYFNLFLPTTEKKEYKSSLAINYSKNDIYVWCGLTIDLLTIKKLEFGRLITDKEGNEQTNWIKGVFINNERFCTTFLQRSFDSQYFDKKITPYKKKTINLIVEFIIK